MRIHPLPLSLLCGLLLAARSAGALLTFWFEGVITRADAAQVDPLFQVGTRFSGSYTVETTTPGVPATDTSFDFHYRDCVASWIVAVQGLADPWGGTSGQISIGDNAPFAGVTDRYAVTLFPDPASPVVFANGRPFRFFQIDMADYRPSGAYFEPVGDMLHSSCQRSVKMYHQRSNQSVPPSGAENSRDKDARYVGGWSWPIRFP